MIPSVSQQERNKCLSLSHLLFLAAALLDYIFFVSHLWCFGDSPCLEIRNIFTKNCIDRQGTSQTTVMGSSKKKKKSHGGELSPFLGRTRMNTLHIAAKLPFFNKSFISDRRFGRLDKLATSQVLSRVIVIEYCTFLGGIISYLFDCCNPVRSV